MCGWSSKENHRSSLSEFSVCQFVKTACLQCRDAESDREECCRGKSRQVWFAEPGPASVEKVWELGTQAKKPLTATFLLQVLYKVVILKLEKKDAQ